MDELDGGGSSIGQLLAVAAAGLGDGQAEAGPDAGPAREDGVANRAPQGGRTAAAGHRRQGALERFFDAASSAGDRTGEHTHARKMMS
ncbi:MAG: hypothetical protein WKG00_29090 [Polyangiaceae bacterium]